MQRLVIRLLGEPSIHFDGRPLRLPSPPRCLSLLALLALRRAEAPTRAKLAGAMWPDELDADARANLRRHIHLLQQSLPSIEGTQWLTSTPRTVAWNADAPAWFDVVAFEELAAGSQHRADAIELYRGDLLEGSYDEFLLADRERLRNAYIGVCFDAATRARRDLQFRDAIGFADRIIAMDEWREDALRLAMTLHNEAGDRASALGTFERFAKKLKSEMGVAPMPETLALRDAILTNAPIDRMTADEVLITNEPAREPQLPFVGRGDEISTLEAAWRHAARGRGTVAFVGGEAGIGKTRLVAEFASNAGAQGGRVLWGDTSNPQAYPYEPIVDAMRRALSMILDAPPAQPWLSALAEILPELHAAFPDAPEPAALEARDAQTRLFEAIARTIERLARARPVLLVVEDVHWAQVATLQLIETLAKRIGGVPAVMVVTYRSGEVTPGHELAALRRRLEAQRLATTVTLQALHSNDVAEIVAKSGDFEGTQVLGESLFAESEGNPLFVALLLRIYGETGALPEQGVASPSIAQTIHTRTARLDPLARRLLQTAAVIGRSFTSHVLADVLGWNESEVLDALGAVLERGFVRIAGSSAFAYAFTHALIEASVYGEISSAERTGLHRRVAAVLAEIHGNDGQALPTIARHWKLAGDGARAARTYLAAAKAALEVHARDEAIASAQEALALEAAPQHRFDTLRTIVTAQEHYAPVESWNDVLTKLESVVESLGDEERYVALELRARYYAQTGDRRNEGWLLEAMLALAECHGWKERTIDVLDARGTLEIGLGRFREAIEAFREAMAVARNVGDRERISLVRQHLTQALMRTGNVEAASTELELLRAEIPKGAPSPERLKLLWAESSLGIAREDPSLIARVGAEMLEIAKQIGDQETRAKAHWLLGWAAMVEGDAAAIRREYGAAAELFERLAQPQSLAATLINLGAHYSEGGMFDRALECCRRGAELSEQTGARNVAAVALSNWADIERIRGNYATAVELATRSLAFAEPSGDARSIAGAYAMLGTAECASGDVAPGLEHLRAAIELRRRSDSKDSLREDLRRIVEALVEAGQPGEAIALAAELEELLRENPSPRRVSTEVYVTLAKLNRRLGNAEKSAQLIAYGRTLYESQAAELPDEETRAAFAQLPHNRSLLEKEKV